MKKETAELEIRLTSEQDVPLILNFIRQLAAYEKLSHEVIATESSIRQSLFGDTAHAESLVAFYKKQPVGFALYFHNYSTFLGKPGIYLEDLFVIPEMRGRGFGTSLLKYVAKIARQRNCGRFEWAVLDWNEPAVRFYKKLGAQPMDEWTTFRVTGDALDRLADGS
jgi:GNAT superfamily N-acetyltransferase